MELTTRASSSDDESAFKIVLFLGFLGGVRSLLPSLPTLDNVRSLIKIGLTSNGPIFPLATREACNQANDFTFSAGYIFRWNVKTELACRFLEPICQFQFFFFF
jgi:hypothetical protein